MRWVGIGWRRSQFPAGETARTIMPFSEIRNCRKTTSWGKRKEAATVPGSVLRTVDIAL